MPEVEMRNPFPLERVHLMPAVDDAQVNGPREIEAPYWRVGVPSPPFDKHWAPAHSTRTLSVPNVTDFGGEEVRHSVEVKGGLPKL
jgi:hypothetical protein